MNFHSLHKNCIDGFGFYFFENGSDQKIRVTMRPSKPGGVDLRKLNFSYQVVYPQGAGQEKTVVVTLEPQTVDIAIWARVDPRSGPSFNIVKLELI